MTERPLTTSMICQFTWALMWRSLIFSTLLGTTISMVLAFIPGFCLGFLGRMIGLDKATVTLLGGVAGFIIGLAVQLPIFFLIIKHVLTLRFSTFRLVAVDHTTPPNSNSTDSL